MGSRGDRTARRGTVIQLLRVKLGSDMGLAGIAKISQIDRLCAVRNEDVVASLVGDAFCRRHGVVGGGGKIRRPTGQSATKWMRKR